MNLIINRNAEKYITLQRTSLDKQSVASSYYDSIVSDYDSIKSHLPNKCARSLDIGCGIGGIDLMLNRHYNGSTELNLLDFNKIDDKVYYGFKDKTSSYNSLDMTAEFLRNNGVSPDNIKTHDANGDFPGGKFDLIISLISWGFHYPISTYLKQVKAAQGGIIIMDVRKDTGQIESLQNEFKSVETVAEWQKYVRLVIQ